MQPAPTGPASASRSTPPPTPPPLNRFRRDPRLAPLYDRDIAPVWTQPFGRLLLQHVAPLGKATVLDVMCHTGYPGLELLKRYPQARVFAVDPSSALLEVARQKAGSAASRRVFFKTEAAEPHLPYDQGVFDLVISNLGLYDVAQPRLLLREMARVAKPGAQVVCTLPLHGTFAEFYALLESLCVSRPHAAARLRTHLATWPEAARVISWAREAGLVDLELVCAPFSLLIAGGTDLFFAPVFEYGPLTAWKAILGNFGHEMQAAFAELKDAIDTSCRGSAERGRELPLSLTVRAACLRARRPMPTSPPALLLPPLADNEATDPAAPAAHVPTAATDKGPSRRP